MSRAPSPSGRDDVLDLDSGLRALQSSPEFRGPVESLDGHDSNDHLALIYENQRELFAAAVPFMRQGLDRGERCMYVADENSKEEVLAAMRARGIDVDAALDSGSLTVHTKQDTYHRNGAFDPDEMISFLDGAIDDAVEEYEALRIAGEMTWVFGDEPATESLVEYEGKLNELMPDEDCIALCQYNRERFPAEVLRDVIRTHPHLVYDNTVCHNFYYTPPEEFFGPEQPARDIDRMMNTLLERTEAKTTLQERQEYLREQNQITADPSRSFEGKLQALFDLGCERFDLELGAMARVDPENDRFEVEYVSTEHEYFETGFELPLSETYCTAATDVGGPASVSNPIEAGYDDIHVYREFGIKAYLGTAIEVDGGFDRTFFFVSAEPRDEPFTDEERTFQQLVGQWVKYELERQRREDRLAALNTLARELMEAETATEVTEYIVDATEETLDLPAAAVALYDRQEGRLRPAALTDDAEAVLEATSLLEIGEGAGWNAFVQNDTRRVSEPFDETDASPCPPVTEMAAFPLGKEGVLLAGSTAADGFSPADFDFAETVAANTESALDRANRERQLQERETALQEQNETLERLTRVNDIIRSIDQALVQASTRDEIEAVVCAQLAETGPYELAWVGEHDAVGQDVTPQEWAGADKGYLEEITITTDSEPESEGPVGRAVATGEPQVVNNILEDERFEPWRQDALNRGYHAVAALPLVYEGTLYGVLNVYAGQPGVFEDLEQVVLAELADNIAYAINAVESKKALVSDEVTELEFSIADPDFGVVRLVEESGCEFAHESLVSRTDGGLQTFFSTRGAAADAALESAAAHLSATGVELVSERREDGEPVCLFEATVTEESLPATVLQHGGQLRRLRAVDGTATVTIHLAADAAIREFVEMFTSSYPGAELVAQRSREQQNRTLTEFRTALTETLTPRQLEVLQTAYFSGYFEQPRTRTGSEIAATLDISQPTFNTHLRTAQRKLYYQLLEEETLRS